MTPQHTQHLLSLSDDLGSLRIDCSCGWHTFADLTDLWVPDLLAIEAAHLAATTPGDDQ